MTEDFCCNCRFAKPSWIGYMSICKIHKKYVKDDDTCEDFTEKKLKVIPSD